MDPENAIFVLLPLALAITGAVLGLMWFLKKKRIAGFSFTAAAVIAACYFLSAEDWNWSLNEYTKIAALTLTSAVAIIIWQSVPKLAKK